VEDSKKHIPKEEVTRSESISSFKKITSEELDFNPKIFLKTFHSVDWKNLWDLFLFKFCMGFSVILFRSNFSLVMKETFQVSPKTIGYLISYSGCVSAFIGFFVGYIANFYKNDARLVLHMAVLQAFTLFMLSFVQSFWLYVLFLTPLSFITTVSRVASTSLTIQRGQKKEIGTLIGFSQSVMSIARMLAPFVSGLALDFSSSGPSLIGCVVSLIGVIVMLVCPQDVPVIEKMKKNSLIRGKCS
jgi:predicted MFS family arabinose efflux permease